MPCLVDQCGHQPHRRGWCVSHYTQWKKHGDPLKRVRRVRGTGSVSHGYLVHGSNHRPAHVLIAEKLLGKPLPPGAVVHHADGDRSNNLPENLVICPSRAYHALLHLRMRALEATGNPDSRNCHICHEWDIPANLRICGKRVVHRDCDNAQRRRTYAKSRERNPNGSLCL